MGGSDAQGVEEDPVVGIQNNVDKMLMSFVETIGSVAVKGHLPESETTSKEVLTNLFEKIMADLDNLPDINKNRETQMQELEELVQENINARKELEKTIENADNILNRLVMARDNLEDAALQPNNSHLV